MTTCPQCSYTVAPLANVTGVLVETTEHGKVRLLRYVCPECGVEGEVRTSRKVADLATFLLQARPTFAQLRVDAEFARIVEELS